MIRKLIYVFGFMIILGTAHAQPGVNLPVATDTIILKENMAGGRAFLVYQDSILRVMASEQAICNSLEMFGPNDQMNRIFKEVKTRNSVDFFTAGKKADNWGMVSLLRELLRKGSCFVIKRKDDTKVETVISKTYSEKGTKGVRYYADGILLLDYIDLADR